jgi:glycosyltransferase involved in cell wall biosynthesis
LLGRREDMPAVMSSLDVLASSSVVEGFPNVLGEAMSCAVPCVATDAGDSRIIIGNTGIVVPIGDASSLAAGILQIVRMGTAERTALGQRARQRIIDDFSLARAVQSYERLYDELTEPCAA